MLFHGESMFEASFDRFAKTYHDVRPAYPDDMYRDIAHECSLDAGARVLEIGAGTGLATKKLADHGWEVTAIEPGKNLLTIADRELAGFQNVRLLNTTFEEFSSTERFRAIISATAFHWIAAEDKFGRCASLLSPGGSLILTWNSFCQSTSPAAAAVDAIYKTCFSTSRESDDANLKTLNKIIRREQEILSSKVFYLKFVRRYLRRYEYGPAQYVALLNTFPNVINADARIKESFFERVATTVAEHGGIVVPVLSSCYVCSRVSDFASSIDA